MVKCLTRTCLMEKELYKSMKNGSEAALEAGDVAGNAVVNMLVYMSVAKRNTLLPRMVQQHLRKNYNHETTLDKCRGFLTAANQLNSTPSKAGDGDAQGDET
jgi:hypothetical protein